VYKSAKVEMNIQADGQTEKEKKMGEDRKMVVQNRASRKRLWRGCGAVIAQQLQFLLYFADCTKCSLFSCGEK
jgi:hypothetical protein